MLFLYRFNFDCGVDGRFEGLFVVDEVGKSRLEEIISNQIEVGLGDFLGEHNDAPQVVNREDFTLISTNQNDITAILRAFRVSNVNEYVTLCGSNPLDYVEEEEIDEDEE